MRPYVRWLERLDAPGILAVSSPRTWATLFPTWLAILAAETYLPPVAGVFQLRPRAVLGAMGVLALGAALVEHLRRKGAPSVQVLGAVAGGSVLMQATVATMAVCSSGTGKFINALLFFLVVLSHSWTFRVSTRAPFMAAGTALAALAPTLLDPSPDNLSLFGAMAAGGATLSLIVGTLAEVQSVHTARSAASREALSAQLLKQSQLEIAGWERRFVGLLGVQHDIRNLLATATLRAQVTARELASGDEPLAREKLVRALAVINDALGAVNSLAREAGTPSQGDASEASPVQLDACLLRALAEANALGLRGRVTLAGPCPTCTGRVPGGEVTIRRILDNLLRNALEGNGQRQATSVMVSASSDGRFLQLCIEDDGPGFPDELLHSGPRLFNTTKETGSGLGLITAEALVAAAAGVMRRSNRPAGGAKVDLYLPLSDAAEAQLTGA